jgi:hypothetical protein
MSSSEVLKLLQDHPVGQSKMEDNLKFMEDNLKIEDDNLQMVKMYKASMAPSERLVLVKCINIGLN